MTSPAIFSASITDIQLESREGSEVRWRMTLSKTEFRPGDTGSLEAKSRSGRAINIEVLRVLDDSGDIWHVVEKPLAAGTDVVGHVTPRP